MFIELAAEITGDQNQFRDKLVQINVYDACMEDFKKHGVDLLSFLKMLGFPKCLIMEVPLIHNVGISVDGQRQFRADLPDSDAVAASVTPTVAEPETKRQTVDVLKEVKEEIMETTMDIEQQRQSQYPVVPPETLNCGSDLFNADISVVQPGGVGNQSIDLDSTSNRLDDMLFNVRDEVVSPGALSFSGIPAPCRTSTRIDEDLVLDKISTESSALVGCCSKFNGIVPKGNSSKEIGSASADDLQRRNYEMENANLVLAGSNSKGCSADANAAPESHVCDHRALAENSSYEACRLDKSKLKDNGEEENPLERVSSNLSIHTVVLDKLQDGLDSMASADQAIRSDLCPPLGNGTMEVAHGDIQNSKGNNQLDRTKPGDVVNDADVDVHIEMELCDSDPSPRFLKNANIADNGEDKKDLQCSYYYYNPTTSAVTDNKVDSIFHGEVKQEVSTEENEFGSRSVAMNNSMVDASMAKHSPSFTAPAATSPQKVSPINKSEESFNPDDFGSGDDFEDAPEYRNDEDHSPGPKKIANQRRNRKAVFPCLYPNCEFKVRQRKFIHQKMVAHVHTHSPFPMFPCLVNGCDALFKTSPLVAQHYAKEHRYVQFPKVQTIKQEGARRLPVGIEAELWKQCFPNMLKYHPKKLPFGSVESDPALQRKLI